MRSYAEVGDAITLKNFSFINKAGGTGISNWQHDETFKKSITVKVTKEWEDEECGQRGWAVPNPKNKELMDYLHKNATEGKYNDEFEVVFEKDYFVIFWSEFDVINIIPSIKLCEIKI